MFYLKWTPSELATLRAGALYTEVDEDGWVQCYQGCCRTCTPGTPGCN